MISFNKIIFKFYIKGLSLKKKICEIFLNNVIWVNVYFGLNVFKRG